MKKGWIQAHKDGTQEDFAPKTTADVVFTDDTQSKTVAQEMLSKTNGGAFSGHIMGYSKSVPTKADKFYYSPLEIREVNTVGASQDAIEYAPAVGFHWSGRAGCALALGSDTQFHRVNSNGDFKMVDTENLLALVFNKLHPVGSIYMTTNAINPASTMGFGSWVAWGSGRVPVGVDGGQGEFNAVEKAGGAKTHSLVSGEMPYHGHSYCPQYRLAQYPSPMHTGEALMGSTGAYTLNTFNAIPNQWTGMAGGNEPHNNLPPYITCYMWKRTA